MKYTFSKWDTYPMTGDISYSRYINMWWRGHKLYGTTYKDSLDDMTIDYRPVVVVTGPTFSIIVIKHKHEVTTHSENLLNGEVYYLQGWYPSVNWQHGQCDGGVPRISQKLSVYQDVSSDLQIHERYQNKRS